MKIKTIVRSLPIQTFLALLVFTGILIAVQRFWNPSKGLQASLLGKYVHEFGDIAPPHEPLLPVMKVPEHTSSTPSTSIARRGQPALSPTPFLQNEHPGLDHFYAALADLQAHKRTAPVRIVHYGDSPTTADLITGGNRELLQNIFGDAGHGFLLAAKPWAWYDHHGMTISDSGWRIETAVGTMREGAYGLGGSYIVGSVGAKTKIKFADKAYSYVDVYYEKQPGGGKVQVSADGQALEIISTADDERGSGFKRIALPIGASSIELSPTAGSVRLYGIDIGKDSPGITYDSLGLNGASTIVLSRVFERNQWTEQLVHRNPDLVIINYGTNESGFVSWIDRQYEMELRTAITKLREALPNASILVMSPMDRGERSGAEIRTMPGILHIVEIQKRVAKDTGCAFFNTFEAMGGESTMERWYDGHPRLVAADLIHPSPQGAEIVSDAFVKALILGYGSYKQSESSQAQQQAPKDLARSDEKAVH